MEKRYINRIILGVILAVLFIFICVIAGKHAERSMIKFFHNFEESAVSYAREYNNDVIAGKVNLYELDGVKVSSDDKCTKLTYTCGDFRIIDSYDKLVRTFDVDIMYTKYEGALILLFMFGTIIFSFALAFLFLGIYTLITNKGWFGTN